MLRYLLVFAIACGGSSKSPSQPSVDKLDTPVASEPGPFAPTSQAAIAAKLNTEGVRELDAGHLPEAIKNIREAVARVPSPRYFFNLCIAVYRDGRLDEAATACGAIEHNNPDPELASRAAKALDLIKTEAQRRGIKLQPGGDALPDPSTLSSEPLL